MGKNSNNNNYDFNIKINRSTISKQKLFVLRLDHRPHRDLRISTHTALVARAFGMDGIFFSGVPDKKLCEKVNKVTENFGGDFLVRTGCDWKKIIKEWLSQGGEIIHLSMYGLTLPEIIEKIRNSSKDKLVVIGGPKVPREIYSIATYNVSVTNQPHSEIAALAVFLNYYHKGQEFYYEFKNAKIKIIPNKNGKKFAT
ncbi:MAG: tRNA (cytidine(56)-2'-O)-methyltransferase [Candidatus Jordarchaeum sp.]|uniref:tRNA (cytidine(56)-2'-O)-methyltransferase n=1 Tax=Candidatus Jordarchaeum sp. TaxID=2823881 RepID=UPI004049FB2C